MQAMRLIGAQWRAVRAVVGQVQRGGSRSWLGSGRSLFLTCVAVWAVACRAGYHCRAWLI